MRKRVLSLLLSGAMLAGTAGGLGGAFAPVSADASGSARQVEYLNRGLVAVRVEGGVYLSWRLLGTEAASTVFDIYKNGQIMKSGVDATNYTDDEGFDTDVYQVVPAGAGTDNEQETTVWGANYLDIPINKPTGVTDNDKGKDCTYSANDASVADLDGDGEYEIILKWDPSNSKDNSQHGYTGNVYIDAYKMDGTQLWRIDLGKNIRAGAHYTQFIAYDFDGDGKAEMALRTAPGSKDGNGNYVSQAGENLTWDGYNDQSDLRQGGSKNGHIIKGPDWLTMFNGETGEAMETIDYYPQRRSVKSWGDSYGGRSERYLAGVAYLDGVHPSLIMTRGYYEKAAMAAFDWDGQHFTMRWGKTYTEKAGDSLYAQGTHSLSVADVDNDGFDEVIFGSAVMDHNGTVLNSTGHGHGDALHVSDFNNDGKQEIMMVHEEKTYYKTWGAEVRRGSDAAILAKVPSSGDTGRGVMANIDDSNPGSEFWSTANTQLYDQNGKVLTKKVSTGATGGGDMTETTVNVEAPSSTNFLIWWDGDLSRELLDRNRIDKFSIQDGQKRLETFEGIHYNNSSKATPSLSADIFGDWREEVMYPTGDDKALRIYTTTTPTEYKIPSLMHDTQYRCAVAWQNVAYNQPPHPSFFVGGEVASGNTISPAVPFNGVNPVKSDYTAPDPETPDEIISSVIPRQTYNDSTGDTGGFSGSVSVETLAAPYKNALKISGSAVKTFDEILDSSHDNSIRMQFSWQPKNASDKIEFQDENGSTIFALSAQMPLKYSNGAGEKKTIDNTLSALGHWYNFTLNFDFTAKLVDIEAIDYTQKGSAKKEVYCVSFAGLGSRLDNMKITGTSSGTYFDNLAVSSVSYTIPRGQVTFRVMKDDAPLEGAQITVGDKILGTDASGTAVIMMKEGVYPYTVKKAELHTETGELNVTADGVTENVITRDGDPCDIYVIYSSDEVVLKPAVKVATQVENTTYTLDDSAKEDILYNSDDALVPSGLYEYDPDKTEASAVTVEGDTYIRMIYKKKRTPGQFDTDLLRVNFGEFGVGRKAWTSTVSPNYEEDDSGRRYAKFSNLGTAKQVVVNINTSQVKDKTLPYVIEYDIMMDGLLYGGHQYGMVPYSGSSKGREITMRTSSPTNMQWQWGYYEASGGGIHFSYLPQAKEGKEYSYATNWQNQWAHVILEYTGGKSYATVVNLNNGMTYVDRQEVPVDNQVGGSNVINKLVFKNVYKNKDGGDADWSIGLANLKVYQINGPTKAEWDFEQARLPVNSTTNVAPSVLSHESDVAGVDFAIGGVEYELQDEDGNAVTQGVKIEGDNITLDDTVQRKSYTLAAKYAGDVIKTIPVRLAEKEGLYISQFNHEKTVTAENKNDDIEGWKLDQSGLSLATLSDKAGTLTFNVDNASGGRTFYRKFEPTDSSTAHLTLDFNTGGISGLDGSGYNWSTEHKYTYYLEFVDDQYDASVMHDNQSANVLFGLKQSMAAKAGNVSAYGKVAEKDVTAAGAQEIINVPYGSDGKNTAAYQKANGDTAAVGTQTVKPSYYFARSITTWHIEADINYDQKTMSVSITNPDSKNGYLFKDIDIGDSKFGMIRVASKKDGSKVSWKPMLSGVEYTTEYYTPAAPQITSARTGDNAGEAIISFNVQDTGNAQITSYSVVPYLGQQRLDAVTTTTDSATITGLEKGEYTFRVYAQNRVGLSSGSEHSEPVVITESGGSFNVKKLAVENGNAVVQVSNTTAGTKTAYLIAAVYTDGQLTGVKSKKISVAANTETYTDSVAMPQGGDTQKAFLWDGMTNLKPIPMAK